MKKKKGRAERNDKKAKGGKKIRERDEDLDDLYDDDSDEEFEKPSVIKKGDGKKPCAAKTTKSVGKPKTPPQKVMRKRSVEDGPCNFFFVGLRGGSAEAIQSALKAAASFMG